MRSLRELADCLGLDDTYHVVRDFFGYTTGAPRQLSVLTQVKLLLGYYVSINVIRVGAESFGEAEDREIDGAIAFMRDTYATVDFGVKRIRRFHISTADANGREHIADDHEAKELTREWTVDNYAIDVFFVLTYAGSTIGFAPRKGPEDKNVRAMSGVVLAIEGSTAVTGFVLAREVARYLGLKDSKNENNLMFPTVPNGGHLTHEQGHDMKHYTYQAAVFTWPGCDVDVVLRW